MPVDPNAESWAFQYRESEDGTGIQAIAFEDLIHKFPEQRIDLLKVDIEAPSALCFSLAQIG